MKGLAFVFDLPAHEATCAHDLNPDVICTFSLLAPASLNKDSYLHAFWRCLYDLLKKEK